MHLSPPVRALLAELRPAATKTDALVFVGVGGRAVTGLARRETIDMPITQMVAALVENRIDLSDAVTALLSRPLKPE